MCSPACMCSIRSACALRCLKADEFKKHRAVSFGVYTLAGLIILATMFLKQHSVLDTVGACIMAWVLYQFVYAPQRRRVPGYSKKKDRYYKAERSGYDIKT